MCPWGKSDRCCFSHSLSFPPCGWDRVQSGPCSCHPHHQELFCLLLLNDLHTKLRFCWDHTSSGRNIFRNVTRSSNKRVYICIDGLCIDICVRQWWVNECVGEGGWEKEPKGRGGFIPAAKHDISWLGLRSPAGATSVCLPFIPLCSSGKMAELPATGHRPQRQPALSTPASQSLSQLGSCCLGPEAQAPSCSVYPSPGPVWSSARSPSVHTPVTSSPQRKDHAGFTPLSCSCWN